MVKLFDLVTNKLKSYDPADGVEALYYQKARIPTNKEINDKEIAKIKDELSKSDLRIPLYDPYSDNLYLIHRDNLYPRVVLMHYRFPTKILLEELKNKKTMNESNHIVIDEVLESRQMKKLELMITFLESFDLELYETTYVKLFYYYANEVGKNITLCKRPSFIPQYQYISPYYTRSEIINLALNMGIIKSDKTYYDSKKLNDLCHQIQNNDINASVLLQHHNYIAEQNKIGLVQYYSLQGAFAMNQYLRKFVAYKEKNSFLESEIKEVWNLILHAPAFDKEYIVYRFVSKDDYLRHLNIGDKYIDDGFLSTTRDPFYRADEFSFGSVLIKIKIPANKIGVGLCMETYSHFSKEQEILLPPRTVLQLDKKDKNCSYYHTDAMYAAKIETRYEFSLIETEPVKIENRIELPAQPLTEFVNFPLHEGMVLHDLTKLFVSNYTNKMRQFRVKIGEFVMTLQADWFDSTGAYKEFYGAENQKNGFHIYSIYDHHVILSMEIIQLDDINFMYVNFYFQHSIQPPTKPYSDQDLLVLIAQVGHYFCVDAAFIFANFVSCSVHDASVLKSDHYCEDIYEYLKNGRKRFHETDVKRYELKESFDYHQLDKLSTSSPSLILKKDDRDELYQLYTKVYVSENKPDNLKDFYIWIVENHCFLISKLHDKTIRLYPDETNPFMYFYFKFETSSYLYNRGIINRIPFRRDNIAHIVGYVERLPLTAEILIPTTQRIRQ